MILWFSPAVLFAISIVALLLPLLRRENEVEEDQEMMVYQDQLAEVNRDLDRGLLNEQTAGEMRTEIERRLKRLKPISERQDKLEGRQKPQISVIIGLILFIPIASYGIYAGIGSPDKEDLPFASRQIGAKGTSSAREKGIISEQPELSNLAESLANKMKNRPKSLDGWMLLGRTYMTLERWDDAAKAFSRAYTLSPAGPDVAASYVEALYMVNGTKFTDQSKTILQAALKANERDPKSLFYWGLALSQQNKHKAALQNWVNLMTISNADAPWMPTLRRRINQSVEVSGINLTQIKPTLKPSKQASQKLQALSPPDNVPGPTREDVEAAKKMSGEDRMAFIRSMVERLADRLKDEPNDIQGWRRLARAYKVLGEAEKAKTAQARVREIEGRQN